jgi:hypothetical protein
MQDHEFKIPILALAPEEAAIASGRTRTRIFEAINSGELQARKDGKAVIIEVPELQRWIRTFPIRPMRHGRASGEAA